MSSQLLPSDFPALYEFSTRTKYALGSIDTFLVGRHADADLILLDVTCSRQQFRIVRQGARFVLERLSANVETRCDGQVVDTPIPLKHGMVIEAGSSRFQFLEYEDTAVKRDLAAKGPVSERVAPVEPSAAEMRTTVGTGIAEQDTVAPVKPIPLSGQMLMGRDPQRVQIVLPHARVSRVHARITLQGQTAIVSDLNSANGTFVNGRRVVRPTLVRPNDRIDIGPYALVFDGQCLSSRSRVDNVELVCRNLRRVVKDRTSGRPLALLDDVTLVVRPKELVAILGPSGSGKSTLLSALSARVPAEGGQVTINGQDFYANFDALKHDVAVVPQNIALHDTLALRTALLYTAKLRLPPDTSEGERRVAVGEMLATVGLAERQNTKIRDLSGGQTKRVSLANEIVSKPSLLFLDEATSGLDEQTDREMMKLFREIADTGKTVLCITHNSTNVEQYCDLVVVLASGGKLAFVGSPAEALQYFGIKRLGDVYEKLSERQPEEWKRKFLQHNLYSKYIDRRLPVKDDMDTPAVPENAAPLGQQVQLLLRQVGILTGRYLKLQIADMRSLATIFGQCLLVALLLVIFYGDLDKVGFDEKAANSGNIAFLLALSCLWFGCNNAAKEIVKERTIYLRERDVNVVVLSYYASKLLLLGTICVVQASVLLWIVKHFTNLPGDFAGQWAFLAMLSLVGVAMGLLISAVSKTNDNAVGMVPAALLPQIILAGVIAPVEGLAKLLAQVFISAYWGYWGLATVLPEDICTILGGEDWSTTGAFCVLVLHFCVLVAAAVGALMFADPGARLSTAKALRKWVAAAKAKLDRR